MLISAAVDPHVTQVVDVVKDVHAMLPKSIFTRGGVADSSRGACRRWM